MGSETNSYVAGREHWNERYYRDAKTRHNWQLTAAVFAGLSMLSLGGLLYVVRQQQVSVIVAQVDFQGNVLKTYQADEQAVTVPTTTLVGAELTRWIKQAREMSADWQHQKLEYAGLYRKVSGSAEGTLGEYFKLNPPHVTAQQFTVSVQIASLLREADKTWRARWTEEKREKVTGRVTETTTWEATLTVEMRPPQTPQAALDNPFGVYVTHLSWGQTVEAIERE
jgi:type IV secretory pathway TrbF-like protein